MSGDLGLAVHPIRNSGETWHILSAEAPSTITNAGARPGRVLAVELDLRFLASSPHRAVCPQDPETRPPRLLDEVRLAAEDLPPVRTRPPSFLDYPADDTPTVE